MKKLKGTQTFLTVPPKVAKVEDLPIYGDIPRRQSFIIISNEVSYLTHTIHKYPSKFIPQIPRWAIRRYLGDEQFKNILDPLCGSGTTLVEGLLAGHNVYGIDVDPLARLVTKVKITPIAEDKLRRVCKQVICEVEARKEGQFRPKIPTLKHWFCDEAINDLSVIRDVIETFRDDKDIYDFLLVTMSAIIRKVSNADDESQKTYVSHTNPKTPIPAKPYFIQTLEKYCERLVEFSNRKPQGALHFIFEDADARYVEKAFRNKNLGMVDLVVTSPPYIKAVDYIYTQMAEYFWIGDLFGLSDQKSQNEYKRRYIGTKMVYANEYSELKQVGVPRIDDSIQRIYIKNRKHAYITYAFFRDMRMALDGIHSILEKGGHCVIVIGNCNVSGEQIPVHEYLIEIAGKVGFELSNLFYYKIRNRYMRFPRNGRGGLITDDWVIDLLKR